MMSDYSTSPSLSHILRRTADVFSQLQINPLSFTISYGQVSVDNTSFCQLLFSSSLGGGPDTNTILAEPPLFTSPSPPHTDSISLILDVMRKVADILDQQQLVTAYLSISSDRVSVDEHSFRQLFLGDSMIGIRKNSFIALKAEKFGVLWTTQYYRHVNTDGVYELVTL